MKYRHRNFETPRSLLKRVSPELLMSYFASHKALARFDWNSFTHNQWQLMDDLMEEYQQLPPKTLVEIGEELRRINDLSGLAAQETLRAVCRQYKLLWDDEMPPEDRTMRVLLENEEAFSAAYDWACLESYESFNDYLGVKPRQPKEWDKISQILTDAWKLILQNRNSNFGRVYIEHYGALDRSAYLIYYEAPRKYITRFDDGDDKPAEKPDKPVLEALMIYYPQEGKLKVKARWVDIAEQARDAYARLAIGDEHFFKAASNERTYELNQFKKRMDTLDFPTEPEDGIASVKLTSICFRPNGLTKDSVEVSSVKNLRERLRALKIDLTDAVIKNVKLQVKYAGTGQGNSKTVKLSLPNKNTLGDSHKDRLLEQYLVKWGVANR